MKRLPACLFVASLICSQTSADDYKVEEVRQRPEVAEAIAEHLGASGLKVTGPKRDLCEIWLAKDVAVAGGFQKSPTVTYPFTPGQFVGVLVVPKRSELTDFKGHAIESGTYTLRYGRQPQDGNHVGTSDTLDFLLALPAANEESAAGIDDLDQLVEKSAGASGTTHPAVFSLLPISTVPDMPQVVAVEGKEFFALETVLSAREAKVPLRLVVVGTGEGG